MRARHEWEGDIKPDVKEVMCHYRDWVQLAQRSIKWRAV
jgi:hypothetical protein